MSRTALERYALLEALGLYFDGSGEPPREVVVKFGEATLTLLGTDDLPITHWALASLRRLPGSMPGGTLHLAPGLESEERLEVSDPDMIEALTLVCRDLDGPPPPRSRTPLRLLTGTATLVVALVALYLAVPLLATQIALLVPQARQQMLGRAMVTDLRDTLGDGSPVRVCDAPEGVRAMSRLMTRLTRNDAEGGRITVHVLDHPMQSVFAVPGRRILVFRGLIEAAQSPEELAGLLAHAMGHVLAEDPTGRALALARPLEMLDILFGRIDPETVARLAADLPRTDYDDETEAAAIARAAGLLREAGLPQDAGRELLIRLTEEGDGPLPHAARHVAGAPPAEADDTRFLPALDDQDWVALRGICDR
ncbi:M48 family metalloprotease [Oceanicella sp. SM1341]|uniref:M48 family metalloprotease n=1 Tax=Oceanicella sp. SM1341 TaxID=1548889 RepID=UPI000E4A6CAB|nr:M48 family metalloprotease [Oceanicella sp. SM1341]